MPWTELPRESRRAVRVCPKGSVRIRHGMRVIGGHVIDLAVGGIRIRTDLPLGLAALLGEPVRVDLRLGGLRREQFAFCGHVLRANGATKLVAIVFDEVTEDFEDRVEDELLSVIERHPPPRIRLAEHPRASRAAITETFHGAGYHVIETSTPR